jgi:hypothetical protein
VLGAEGSVDGVDVRCWRRAKLSLNDGKKMKRGKLVMNHIKRQQLLVEVIMLEQHLA